MMTATDRSEHFWNLAPEYENRKLTVIVADGTPGYFETVLSLLEFHDIVDLVGRAANFEETIELAANLRPDLVLMDIEMPSAMLAIAAIITTSADIQIVGMFDACIPLHAPGLVLSLSAFIDKARLRNDFFPLLHTLRCRSVADPLVCLSQFHADIGRQGAELRFQLRRT